MQLTIITFVVIVLLGLQELKAQLLNLNSSEKYNNIKPDEISNTSTYKRSDWQKVDIDFLTSYYVQDGNNGAVTGGIGTEYLTDFTQKLKVSIPTSPKLSFNIDAAYDYYSSASTDNIDNIRSSDSQSDVRSQLNLGVQYKKNEYLTYGLRVGTSVEYDYTSFNSGFNMSLISKDGNRSFNISGQAYIDKWMLIYPRELRRKVKAETDRRQSYNLSLGYNQVINKRMQLGLMSEITVMKGLLSTPFHRVYFNDNSLAEIERLPGSRIKVPIGLRMNYYLSERLILRSYYRYYKDSWGMNAHTFSLELPVKITRFISIYPHYRYHTQNAVDYFNPYKEHSRDQDYYSSDYDLSELDSHSAGLGIQYGSQKGLFKISTPFKKRPYFVLDQIDIKYSHYRRSNGLNANIISLGLKMGF